MRVTCFIPYLIASFIIGNVCKPIQEIDQENFSIFLRDFVDSQDAPTQVVLFLCCTQGISDIVKNITFSIEYKHCNDLNILMEPRKNSILFVINLKCKNTKNFLDNVVEPKYYAHPFRWMMLVDHITFVPNIKALPDSSIFLFTTTTHLGKEFELKQFYRIEENSPVLLEPYGTWSNSAGLIVSQRDTILSRRRRNLKRKILTASLVITNNDSFNHLEDYRDKHIDSVAKVNYFITKYLIEALNGTMRHIPSSTWGYQDSKTGKWNGMIGHLLGKKADIGGTGLFMTSVRIPQIDYLSMTAPTKTQFIFREPPLSYVTNIYSLPFTGLVWISGGALITFAIIVIACTIKYQKQREFQYGGEEANLRLTDFMLVAISITCQMGTFMQAKLLSARISTIFLLITVLFLYTSYTANIVALLQSTTKSIQTLSDLLKSQLAVAVDDTSYNRYYFPTATEPVRKAIYQKKVLSSKGIPQYMNISEGISRMRKGLFAFQVELGVGYKIIEETFYEHEKCNLMSIPFIQVSDTWYSIAKNSPYKEMLKVNLFKIREHGLQGRENSRIYTKKPVCAATGQSFESVRLTDCYAALVILLIGYGLAISMLFFEKLCKDCKICLI